MATAYESEEALGAPDLAGLNKKRWRPAPSTSIRQRGKVAGIGAFLEVNGLTTGDAFAFGDAENDIEMLEYVGTGVAMDEVKAVADYVTTADRDDGIENVLRCFGLM